MDTRTRFTLATGLFLLVSPILGCAGPSPFSSRTSTNPEAEAATKQAVANNMSQPNRATPASFGQPQEKKSDNIFVQAGNSIKASFDKASKSIQGAFEIKPRVVPAEDPTRLSSKTGPIGPKLYVAAAQLSANGGDIAQATAQFEHAVKVAPNDANTLIAYSRFLQQQHDFLKATKILQKAVAKHPKNTTALNDLGLCYGRQEKMAQAIATLQQAIKIAPENKRYRNNIAAVLVKAHRENEAFAHLTRVYDKASAHYNVGYMLQQNGRVAEARKHFQSALQINPSLVQAKQMLAQIDGPNNTNEPASRYAENYTDRRNDSHSDYHNNNRVNPPTENYTESRGGSYINANTAATIRSEANHRSENNDFRATSPRKIDTRNDVNNRPSQSDSSYSSLARSPKRITTPSPQADRPYNRLRSTEREGEEMPQQSQITPSGEVIATPPVRNAPFRATPKAGKQEAAPLPGAAPLYNDTDATPQRVTPVGWRPGSTRNAADPEIDTKEDVIYNLDG